MQRRAAPSQRGSSTRERRDTNRIHSWEGWDRRSCRGAALNARTCCTYALNAVAWRRRALSMGLPARANQGAPAASAHGALRPAALRHHAPHGGWGSSSQPACRPPVCSTTSASCTSLTPGLILGSRDSAGGGGASSPSVACVATAQTSAACPRTSWRALAARIPHCTLPSAPEWKVGLLMDMGLTRLRRLRSPYHTPTATTAAAAMPPTTAPGSTERRTGAGGDVSGGVAGRGSTPHPHSAACWCSAPTGKHDASSRQRSSPTITPVLAPELSLSVVVVVVVVGPPWPAVLRQQGRAEGTRVSRQQRSSKLAWQRGLGGVGRGEARRRALLHAPCMQAGRQVGTPTWHGARCW